MATKQTTIDFLLEQMEAAGNVHARKMFGEYALYHDEKVVAFVCDDQLFIKPTAAGESRMEWIELAPAYPGSKMYLKVSEEKWDDSEWLCTFVRETADLLPLPKPKKPKLKQ